jgi:hypothetical protein
MSFLDKTARIVRFILIAAIGFFIILLIAAPQKFENPLVVRNAFGEGGVSAAPGYIALNCNGSTSSRFYLIDTNKQVICVYSLNGAKLRLVSARKFDFDAKIVDSSLQGQDAKGRGLKPIEGGNGIDRDIAKDYSEAIQKWLDDAKIKW